MHWVAFGFAVVTVVATMLMAFTLMENRRLERHVEALIRQRNDAEETVRSLKRSLSAAQESREDMLTRIDTIRDALIGNG